MTENNEINGYAGFNYSIYEYIIYSYTVYKYIAQEYSKNNAQEQHKNTYTDGSYDQHVGQPTSPPVQPHPNPLCTRRRDVIFYVHVRGMSILNLKQKKTKIENFVIFWVDGPLK